MIEAPPFDPARRIITITLGDSKACAIWKHRLAQTWNQLVEKLSKSPVGSKDGAAYTPAILKGHVRQLPFVERIDIVVLDSDCRHTLDEIAAAVRQAGFEAVIHSTHSHLTDRAEVSLASLDKHNGDAELVMRGKRVLPRLVSGCRKIGETPDGKRAIIEHQPCPKYRIILPLLDPWRTVEHEERLRKLEERNPGESAY